jgi:molybdenum cofactor cytidylyltransferase
LSTEMLRYRVLPGRSRNSSFKKEDKRWRARKPRSSAFIAQETTIVMPSLNSIAPVILAAGDSTRMGYPKALLPLGEDFFLSRILRTVHDIGLPRANIVLGKSATIIKPHIQDWDANILINPDPSRGQLSSIQLALGRLGLEIDAALIWPVDMPAVPPDVVRRLTELFIRSRALIAFPRYGDKRGHPAIFHRLLFQEFMDAPLEEGPKSILSRHQQETSVLAVLDSAAVKDIDNPSDYQALTGDTLDSALSRRK